MKSKNSLENTESLLSEARQKLAELEAEIEKKDEEAQEYEKRLQSLEDTYTACLEDLEGLNEQIEQTEAENANLQTDLKEWQDMCTKYEDDLQKRCGELDSTKVALQEAENLKQQQEMKIQELGQMCEKLEDEMERKSAELQTTVEYLKATESEKDRVQGDLDDSKEEVAKFEADLHRKDDELQNACNSLASLQQEKATVDVELSEWTQMADKLEAELRTRTAELAEKKKELSETQEALRDADQQKEVLHNMIESCEKQLREKNEENEELSKELKDSSQALKAVKSNVEEASNKISSLEEECLNHKQCNEKLIRQIREQKNERQSLVEEHHESLEATREVLKAKAQKEYNELQENMNKLLNDERKAYRVKNEKAQHDFKKMEEKYLRRMQEERDEADATIKKCKEKSVQLRDEQETKARQEMENLKRHEELKRDNLIRTGEKMIEEAKALAAEALQSVVNERDQLSRCLAEKEEIEQTLTYKNSNLKKNLEYATHKINELEQGQDEQGEIIKKLERAQAKLEEENERYRRQLGGRYGADGQMQNQLDKLSKELMDAHNENLDMKRKLAAKTSSEDMSFDTESSHTGYSRGGVNTHAIAQIRSGYEEQIANLNDEKRELVMKNSAAITDVQKAEQTSWEREQEIANLKVENTSLQLQLKRAQLASATDEDLDTSFYSQARDISFSQRDLSFVNDSSHGLDNDSRIHIEQRKPEGLSVVPSSGVEIADDRVLTPIKKHNENSFSETATEKPKQFDRHIRDLRNSPNHAPAEKSNPYELQVRDVNRHVLGRRDDVDKQEDALLNYTQISSAPEADSQSECNQS